MMYQDDEVRMTYSGILEHNQKKTVRVIFERGQYDKAEGSVPECKITKSTGFTADEIEQLNSFLASNTNDIMERARLINPLVNLVKNR